MGIRISEMEEATTFGADDYVPIVTSGTNKKALGSKIKDFIAGFFVSKSGDTMTGDLLIDKQAPNMRMQDENLTVSTSTTNGLTAETSASLITRDASTQFFGRARGLAKTDGSIEFQLTARNMNTSGSRITNSFSVGVKKDGTRYYSVDDKTEFRKAINTETASITRQSGVSTSVPIPNIERRGNVVIIHFAHQFPAGTYYQLYNVLPLPTGNEHALVDMGGDKDLITLLTNGTMRFNNSKTFNSSTYVIGQIVYLTDD